MLNASKLLQQYEAFFVFFGSPMQLSGEQYPEIPCIRTKLSTKSALRLQYISSTRQDSKTCISNI